MATWYQARKWYDDILPVFVVKESDLFITVQRPATTNAFGTHPGDTRRTAKHSQSENYYPTWEQAKEKLAADLEKEILHLNQQIAAAGKKLAKVKALANPEAK